MPGLTPDQVQKIHEYIHNQQLLHAIKLYREATGVGLAEAKAAVEAMSRNEAVKPPDGVMNYDNPILEGRIRSLLSKRQKIEAVKIYREEYGVGLKEAKDAVDGIERSMRQGSSSMPMPNESAIGSDPFAEKQGTGPRAMLLLAVVMALAICGFGVFIFLLSSYFMPGSKRILIAGDVLTLGLVTAIGFITHRETGLSLALRFAAVYFPLSIIWLLLARWFGLFQPEITSDLRQLGRILPAMLFTAPLAAVVRAWLLQTPIIPIFILVLGGTSALGLLLWRGAYLFLPSRT